MFIVKLSINLLKEILLFCDFIDSLIFLDDEAGILGSCSAWGDPHVTKFVHFYISFYFILYAAGVPVRPAERASA